MPDAAPGKVSTPLEGVAAQTPLYAVGGSHPPPRGGLKHRSCGPACGSLPHVLEAGTQEHTLSLS